MSSRARTQSKHRACARVCAGATTWLSAASLVDLNRIQAATRFLREEGTLPADGGGGRGGDNFTPGRALCRRRQRLVHATPSTVVPGSGPRPPFLRAPSLLVGHSGSPYLLETRRQLGASGRVETWVARAYPWSGPPPFGLDGAGAGPIGCLVDQPRGVRMVSRF